MSDRQSHAEDASPINVLMVAEGSGGHVIPALEVAKVLASTGARVKVWYAKRPQAECLIQALAQECGARIMIDPLPARASAHGLGRLWQCAGLWQAAQRCFGMFRPDVVVGFGGWVSAPILLAARRRHIGCLLHEQNVVMGRANRWLSRWVDRVAVSFAETQTTLGTRPSVVTGMPIRQHIGQASSSEAVDGFGGFGARRNQLVLLVIGGSQGSRSINTRLLHMATLFSPEERQRWHIVHAAGSTDDARVREAYRNLGVSAWVAPFVADMSSVYARADVVIGRAGASTVAELARCGKPAVLIPYPYAHGHQRANAQFVQAIGGGLMIEESHATPELLLSSVRRILTDERLRIMMGRQMRALDVPDAAERLTHTIIELSRKSLPNGVTSPATSEQSHPDASLAAPAMAIPLAGVSSYVH